MKIVYFTITGTNYRFGSEFMEPGMSVRLIKEPKNDYDSEAIRVEMDGLGCVGYVANSTKTVVGKSWSAGRIYDKIGEWAEGKILYKLPMGILCTLDIDGFKFTSDSDVRKHNESCGYDKDDNNSDYDDYDENSENDENCGNNADSDDSDDEGVTFQQTDACNTQAVP